jgi:hypothetical protein
VDRRHLEGAAQIAEIEATPALTKEALDEAKAKLGRLFAPRVVEGEHAETG